MGKEKDRKVRVQKTFQCILFCYQWLLFCVSSTKSALIDCQSKSFPFNYSSLKQHIIFTLNQPKMRIFHPSQNPKEKTTTINQRQQCIPFFLHLQERIAELPSPFLSVTRILSPSLPFFVQHLLLLFNHINQSTNLPDKCRRRWRRCRLLSSFNFIILLMFSPLSYSFWCFSLFFLTCLIDFRPRRHCQVASHGGNCCCCCQRKAASSSSSSFGRSASKDLQTSGKRVPLCDARQDSVSQSVRIDDCHRFSFLPHSCPAYFLPHFLNRRSYFWDKKKRREAAKAK